GGENTYVIARPLLYELLLRKIPPHKIHVGKRVLSILQNDNGVLIRCSDNMTHHGDILVGADGAYSGVRQSLYAQMKKQNLLPKSDSGVLPFTCTCLVGQTDPLDPAEFPEVEEEHCRFSSVVARYVYQQPEYYLLDALHYLDKNTAKDNDAFRNSEWGPEAAEQMCKEVAHLPIPGGNGKLTMKDLIDRTPKDLISKVMLEEKLFKTWHHRRTVLLGDACHKMHPAAGLGAVNAMQDAIVLSSLISSLSTKDERDITGIFKAYREERRPLAESSYKISHTLSKKIEKSVQGAIVRYTMKHMPAWLNKITLSKMVESRPQLSFLPRAEDNGTIKAMYQPSLHRKPAFSLPDNATPAANNKVFIVGAGIGGLALGIFLEKAGLPFEIFDRCDVVRLLGVSVERSWGGGKTYVVAHPFIHDLLLRQIPSHRIYMGKRMTSITQNDRSVTIACTDNTTYHDTPLYASAARPRPPLTAQERAALEKPKVLIVGAGLGGITLGILLERAGIQYMIFERAKERSHWPMVLAHSYNNDMELTQVTDWSVRDKLGGDQHFVVARPTLYDLLRSRIPSHKIFMSKRVLSILQNQHGAMVRCSDNVTHHGDILVGADGAYSGVRQSMYKQLKTQKKLPRSDDTTLPFSCTCLVGQTEVLDLDEFPEINETNSRFHGISEFPYSRVSFTTIHHTICWTVMVSLSAFTVRVETAEAKCKEVGHLKIPGGNGKLTMKDLIDRTPKHLILKAMLEEKVFATWYHR
ncbi:hypothetical protein BGZ52_004740, partial [Haplosporangium bisporale]